MRSLLVLLCCLPLLAGPPKLRRTHVRIPVWVDAGEGSSRSALNAQELTAKLEGAPARVLAVRGPSDDLILLLVLDLVGDLALVDPAKQALVTGLQQLPPNAHVALMRAPDGLRVLLDPTTDRAALADAIQSLPASGKAGLLEAVEPASRIADSILVKSAVRLAVLYVTDSDIYNYREDYTNPVINFSDPGDLSRRFPEGLVREKISKLKTRLAALQAPLFVVHLSYRTDRLNEAYQTGLMQLTQITGGTSIFCHSSAEIPAAVEKTLATIAAHYSVDLEAPDRPPEIIEVELEAAGRTLNYRTRFSLKER